MGNERVAIVTGAAQGLGLAIAKQLLVEGKIVVFIDLQAELLQQVEEELKQEHAGQEWMMIALDVTEYPRVQKAVEEIVKRYQRLDILVNNAGIRKVTPLEELTPQEFNQVLEVNLTSTFYFSQQVLPYMRAGGWGRIINMSSIGGQDGPLSSGAHYAASKAGQLALTKVFARMMASAGVTVNSVAPSAIRTPEADKLAPEVMAKLVESIPLQRIGEPEEVAQLVSYLVSEQGGYVTGATFDINGGRLMR